MLERGLKENKLKFQGRNVFEQLHNWKQTKQCQRKGKLQCRTELFKESGNLKFVSWQVNKIVSCPTLHVKLHLFFLLKKLYLIKHKWLEYMHSCFSFTIPITQNYQMI